MKRCLLVLLAVLTGCSRPPAGPAIVAVPPAVVSVAPPQKRTIHRTVEIPGNVLPLQQAMLYAKVAGYLRELRVDKGDAVAAGQLLATIDSPEMRRDTGQARAALDRSEADVLGAAAQVAAARAALAALEADNRKAIEIVRQAEDSVHAREAERALSRATYLRLKRIRDDDPGLMPRQDLDVARTQAQVADSHLMEARGAVRAARSGADAARARTDGARRQVEAARAQRDSASRQTAVYREGLRKATEMEAYTQIRAPFAGTVTQRYLDAGALVQSAVGSAQGATKPVLVLADYGTVRIQVQVPEPETPFVRPGTSIVVTADTLPKRPFGGRIRRVSRELDTGTRSMLAEAELANPQGLLLPGMLVKVRLDLETLPGRWTVPTDAVAFDKDKRFVFLYEDGKVKRQAVHTGVEGAEWVEIKDGLKGTDRVVVAGKEGVSNGSAVTLQRE